MGRRKPKTLRVSGTTKRRRRRERRVDSVEEKKQSCNVSDINKCSSKVDISSNETLRGSKRGREECKATDLAKNLPMRTERTRRRRKRNSLHHHVSEARTVHAAQSEPSDVKSRESRKWRRRKKRRRTESGASACEAISDKGLEGKNRLKSIIVVPTVGKETVNKRTRTESDLSACKVISKMVIDESLNSNSLMPVVKMEACAAEGGALAVPRALNRARKKLLVLDLNGLLCDVVHGYPNTCIAHDRVGRSAVFKRPFCDDFMRFCSENFDIGVWSSRLKKNVDDVVNIIMRDVRDTLLFCWDASQCTHTGFKTVENRSKPLVLKQLKKLWNKEENDLPWEEGDYSPSNSLLLDDSPYKALCNPPYTGVFPYPFNYKDKNDNSLGPGGDLRVYLEGLALADDVQSYVREHPFGRRAITNASSSWKFYKQVINKIEKPSAKARRHVTL